jgi:DNA-binding GntR family transcriptional regulator
MRTRPARDGIPTANASRPRSPPAHVRISVKEIAQQLRERIASHAIPPGARLREWDVAADFGVPRLSARKALDALTYLGFAERQRNRGIVVCRRELAEILQLFELREVNEGLCARLAARNATPESWDQLIDMFDMPMEDIVQRRDLGAYSQNYERFRHRLMEAAGVPALTELLQRLNDLTIIYGKRVLLVSDRTQHALSDHRAVLDALHRKDAETAEMLRRATISKVRAAVERYYPFIF